MTEPQLSRSRRILRAAFGIDRPPRRVPTSPSRESDPFPASANTVTKIQPDAIQSGKVDPEDPLYVHTLIVWALKKVGMNPEEAAKNATAHQQHAVDAYRATEK